MIYLDDLDNQVDVFKMLPDRLSREEFVKWLGKNLDIVEDLGIPEEFYHKFEMDRNR